MPELPEVETIKEILKKNISNKTIERVEILREKTIVGDAHEFVNSVIGRTIVDMSRKGKFLIFHLDNNTKFLSHLRMEGKYYFYNDQNSHSQFEKVRFMFSDGSMLIYDDSRQFGIISFDLSPLDKLGKEPFDADSNEIYKKFQRTGEPIKTAIMDQNIMAGLGNIYADEVLYLTKIHPLTPAKLVTLNEVKEIVSHSIVVLRQAIKDGGSTIKSYHPSEGADGRFQARLNAYGKVGQACPRCGNTFIKIRVGGRGTTYCPHCQVNKAKPYALGLTGAIGAGKSYVGKYLENKGFIRIDADEIVHNIYGNKDIQKEICELLNIKSFSKENVKAVILKDNTLKKKLEAYIHPQVIAYIETQINSHKSSEKLVVEVPLLFETHMESLFDHTLYIDVDEERQIQNIISRNGNVEKSIALNKNFSKNKEKATFIIENSSTLESLNNKIDELLIKLRK